MPFYQLLSLGSLTQSLLESLEGCCRLRSLWFPNPQTRIDTAICYRCPGMQNGRRRVPFSETVQLSVTSPNGTRSLAPERSDKAQKNQLSALGDKVNYMSPSKAGWGPVGGRHHTSQQTFSISNYKDSVKSPAATLSGFLGLGVSVVTLLQGWTDGRGTGSQLVHPGTSPQLNYHCGLKKDF